MSETSSASAAVREQLVALTDPLREQSIVLEREITRLEGELAELRKTRTAIRNTLQMLNPSSVPKKTTEPSVNNIAPATLTKVEEWLREHRDTLNQNGGFTAKALIRDGLDTISPATLGRALLVLRDRNVVRLDHTGRGNSKWYKVVD
jgi:hypothetical protein